jgi:hypothetical protein
MAHLTVSMAPVENHWFKRAKDGCEDLEDDPRSGSPSTSRNADTWEGDMTDELNISKETIHQILPEEVRKIRPTEIHRLGQTPIMPRLRPDLSRQSQIYWFHFSIS